MTQQKAQTSSFYQLCQRSTLPQPNFVQFKGRARSEGPGSSSKKLRRLAANLRFLAANLRRFVFQTFCFFVGAPWLARPCPEKRARGSLEPTAIYCPYTWAMDWSNEENSGGMITSLRIRA